MLSLRHQTPRVWLYHATSTHLLACQVASGLCPDTTPALASLRAPALCLPCSLPEVDPCIYDISGCDFLPSGAICKVECKEPYRCNATVSRCRANNTVEGLPLEWTPPTCAFSECGFPEPLPQGYVRDGAGTVRRAVGYQGG